jgi:hypothetical protein
MQDPPAEAQAGSDQVRSFARTTRRTTPWAWHDALADEIVTCIYIASRSGGVGTRVHGRADCCRRSPYATMRIALPAYHPTRTTDRYRPVPAPVPVPVPVCGESTK